jgi:hypothetical protein
MLFAPESVAFAHRPLAGEEAERGDGKLPRLEKAEKLLAYRAGSADDGHVQTLVHFELLIPRLRIGLLPGVFLDVHLHPAT